MTPSSGGEIALQPRKSGGAANALVSFPLLAVLALAALLLFLRLGDRALWGPEGRWAEITREMQLTGDYFRPTINGVIYYDKPLLSYWLVAAAASLTGHLDEFAARLPSALAGLLGVALLMSLAWRLYGPPTALAAGFILATSYSYVYFSRLASADIETVAGVLAALALFVWNEKRPGGWWLVAFWASMALTSLTKGLAGFAVPLLVIGVYSLAADGWSVLLERAARGPVPERLSWLAARFGWLVTWKTLLAGAAAAVYFLPFALSYTHIHSNVGLHKVFHENVVRFFFPFDHQEPIYVYLYKIFPLVAPWSLFLPAALLQMHCASKDKSDRFVTSYFWATFLFFTLAGSRRDYYLLPVLPAAALLIARLFVGQRETLHVYARRLMNGGYAVMALLAAAGLLALLPPALRPGPLHGLPTLPGQEIFAVFWVLQLVALGYAFLDFRRERILLSVSAVAYLSLMFLFVFAFPGAERYRGEREFAYAARSRVDGRTDRLVLYRVWGPALLFYLSPVSPVPVYGEGTTIARVIEENPGSWIISHESALRGLPLDGSVADASRAFVWAGTPHLSTEYVLLRPRSVAGIQEGSGPGRH